MPSRRSPRKTPAPRLRTEQLEARDVPATLYVAPDGSDTNPGNDPNAPFKNIQAAVNAAADTGDVIKVAGGTYTRQANLDTFFIGQLQTPNVVTVFNKNVTIAGGFTRADGFRAANPGANRTLIDGQGTSRGLMIVGVNQSVNVGATIDGITITNGRANPITARGGVDRINSFGGGALVDFSDNQTNNRAKQATVKFTNVTFDNNQSVGGAGIPNDLDYGGAGTGGGLAIKFAGDVKLDNVVFFNNKAIGGPGNLRGGVGNGGAVHMDNSTITADRVLFDSNQAISADSNGNGFAAGIPADGTGGAVSLQINSVGTFTRVKASNNFVKGGNAAGTAGIAFGGGFFAEEAVLTVRDSEISGNRTLSGSASAPTASSAEASGGGVLADRSTLVLDRVKIVNNLVTGGDIPATANPALAAPVSGGGVYAFKHSAATQANTVTITNSLIAGNKAIQGQGGTGQSSGSGGGIRLEGVNAVINQSTIANNVLDPKLSFGAGIMLQNDQSLTPTTLVLNSSIVAFNTARPTNPTTAPIGAIVLANGTTLTLSKNVLFNPGVNQEVRAETFLQSPIAPNTPGVINGLANNITGADPQFTNPAGFDYSIKSASPAKDAAVGSPIGVDISNAGRTGTPDAGAYEFGTAGTAPVIPAITGGAAGSGTVQKASPTVTAAALTIPAGQTTGTVTVTVADADTPVNQLTVTASSGNPTLLPNTGVVLTTTGGTRTATITTAAGQSGTSTVTLTVRDPDGNTGTTTFVVTVQSNNPVPATKTTLVGYPQFAVGADAGGGDGVTLYAADQSAVSTGAAGVGGNGVRTAAADFNRDGVADVVVGSGPGVATKVRVLDGKTRAELFTVDPFEASFTGGVYVAAGDLTGDGFADLVITPDEGGGPRCRVFTGAGFGVISDFFGIDDPNFRGGARASIGDINGDGSGELIVAAGFQGGPRVAGYFGPSLATGSPQHAFPDFFAFEQTLRNGTFVAAGDIDGDGKAELIAGGGPGGGPRVTAFSGSGLLAGQFNPVANFFAGNPDNRGGIRVAVKNLDGDTRADLVVGSGTGGGSRVTSYLGKNIPTAGTPAVALDFDAFPGFTGGVFVG